MLAESCIWGVISNYQNGMPKVARKNFDIGEVWNQACYYGNKTFKVVL